MREKTIPTESNELEERMVIPVHEPLAECNSAREEDELSCSLATLNSDSEPSFLNRLWCVEEPGGPANDVCSQEMDPALAAEMVREIMLRECADVRDSSELTQALDAMLADMKAAKSAAALDTAAAGLSVGDSWCKRRGGGGGEDDSPGRMSTDEMEARLISLQLRRHFLLQELRGLSTEMVGQGTALQGMAGAEDDPQNAPAEDAQLSSMEEGSDSADDFRDNTGEGHGGGWTERPPQREWDEQDEGKSAGEEEPLQDLENSKTSAHARDLSGPPPDLLRACLVSGPLSDALQARHAATSPQSAVPVVPGTCHAVAAESGDEERYEVHDGRGDGSESYNTARPWEMKEEIAEVCGSDFEEDEGPEAIDDVRTATDWFHGSFAAFEEEWEGEDEKERRGVVMGEMWDSFEIGEKSEVGTVRKRSPRVRCRRVSQADEEEDYYCQGRGGAVSGAGRIVGGEVNRFPWEWEVEPSKPKGSVVEARERRMSWGDGSVSDDGGSNQGEDEGEGFMGVSPGPPLDGHMASCGVVAGGRPFLSDRKERSTTPTRRHRLSRSLSSVTYKERERGSGGGDGGTLGKSRLKYGAVQPIEEDEGGDSVAGGSAKDRAPVEMKLPRGKGEQEGTERKWREKIPKEVRRVIAGLGIEGVEWLGGGSGAASVLEENSRRVLLNDDNRRVKGGPRTSWVGPSWSWAGPKEDSTLLASQSKVAVEIARANVDKLLVRLETVQNMQTKLQATATSIRGAINRMKMEMVTVSGRAWRAPRQNSADDKENMA